MAGRVRLTREAIIRESGRLVREGGLTALTFQALAARLGVSKQAIIYWYPNKWELIRDFALPELRAEAELAVDALEGARSAADAIERYVRTQVAYHVGDLDRFRMLYLAPQFEGRASLPDEDDLLLPIHRTTSVMYDALEARIAADPGFRPGENPRRLAVSVHVATIGLLTMLSLAEAMDDPMAHATEALIDSLVALLTGPRLPAGV